METARTRVLLVGEAVTAAHVIRPLGLAVGMKQDGYDVVFACDPRHRQMVLREGLEYRPIRTIDRDVFLRRLDRGAPLYTQEELRGYVKDDLQVITETRPDVVVGDFRISMGISAELCGVPYLALSNAHWSPDSRIPAPVPEHPLVDLFGVRVAGAMMGMALPFFLRLQANAVNRLRRAYGLAPVHGKGAPEVYTFGTERLYLDIPELYSEHDVADQSRCIGPVLWAPDLPLPSWWNDLPADRPVAWVSAGSSGNIASMEKAAAALAEIGVAVMVATAGRMKAPAGAFAADFIPGLSAAARADLVVCNGGSGIVYQSLACGKPVLGVPRNMDQYYVMEAVERQGAGRIIRSGGFSAEPFQSAVTALLNQPTYGAAARRLARAIAAQDPIRNLKGAISVVLAAQAPARTTPAVMDLTGDLLPAAAG